MGAGCTKDHFIQDAAEAYIVYLLQAYAVENKVAISDDVAEKHNTFIEYCEDRDILDEFNKSIYKKNIDVVIDKFILDLLSKYPNRKFDFVDVEREFRDKKLKGDFIIQFEDGSSISFSLKNYKKGFNRIQLCSGTWHSFLNNFLFESAGVGTFFDPFTQEVFQGCNREYRDSLIEKLGYDALKEVYTFFDSINDTIKKFYTYGEQARYWKNVSAQWKGDCAAYGLKAAEKIISALDSIPKDMVKNRIIKMAGLNYDEEILLVGNGKYLCSLFNQKYAQILKRVNSTESVVEYITNGKGVQDLVFFMIESFDTNKIIVYKKLFKEYYYVKCRDYGMLTYSKEEYDKDFVYSIFYFPLFVAIWFGTLPSDELIDKNFPFFFIQKLINFIKIFKKEISYYFK